MSGFSSIGTAFGFNSILNLLFSTEIRDVNQSSNRFLLVCQSFSISTIYFVKEKSSEKKPITTSQSPKSQQSICSFLLYIPKKCSNWVYIKKVHFFVLNMAETMNVLLKLFND